MVGAPWEVGGGEGFRAHGGLGIWWILWTWICFHPACVAPKPARKEAPRRELVLCRTKIRSAVAFLAVGHARHVSYFSVGCGMTGI